MDAASIQTNQSCSAQRCGEMSRGERRIDVRRDHFDAARNLAAERRRPRPDEAVPCRPPARPDGADRFMRLLASRASSLPASSRMRSASASPVLAAWPRPVRAHRSCRDPRHRRTCARRSTSAPPMAAGKGRSERCAPTGSGALLFGPQHRLQGFAGDPEAGTAIVDQVAEPADTDHVLGSRQVIAIEPVPL